MTTDPLQPAARAVWEAAVRDDVPDPQTAVVRAAEQHAEFIASAWSATRVAQHLGIPVEAVQRNVQDGQLASFTHEGKLLFPHWQFTESSVLPGLADLLKHLPEELPALAVEGFFTNDAAFDLFINGVRVSPRAWLAAGEGAAAVIPYADEMKVGL